MILLQACSNSVYSLHISDGREDIAQKQANDAERPKVITAAVFNAEQIDGIPALEPERTYDWDLVEQAEKLLQASGAKIEHSQSGGAY
jgi:putative DNA primase/helicase